MIWKLKKISWQLPFREDPRSSRPCAVGFVIFTYNPKSSECYNHCTMGPEFTELVRDKYRFLIAGSDPKFMYSPGCVTLLSHNHSAQPPCLWPPPPVSTVSPPLGFLISIAMSFDPIPTYLFFSLHLYVLLLSRFPLTSNKHFLKYQGNRGKAKATLRHSLYEQSQSFIHSTKTESVLCGTHCFECSECSNSPICRIVFNTKSSYFKDFLHFHRMKHACKLSTCVCVTSSHRLAVHAGWKAEVSRLRRIRESKGKSQAIVMK